MNEETYPVSPVPAPNDWSHRAPLERWYEDYAADFADEE